MRYTLKDDGYVWRVIYKGRNKVGRVWQHSDTKIFHAMIGHTEAQGTSFENAFRNVVAKELGYPSVQALHNHNSKVLAKKRVARQKADHAIDQMLQGHFKAFEDVLLDPETSGALIDSVSRKLLRK